MSQLSNIPKQSYFSAQLQSPITASQTSNIILTAVPSYTPSGETVRFNILDSGGVETITATGWNPTTKVLSGVVRAVATYDGETATAYPHAAGVTVVLSDDWKYFEDIQTAVNSKFDTAGGTITGPVAFSGASTTFRIPNLTEAQRDALVSPQNGLILFNTTSGEFQYYDSGAWQTVGTASVPNASETVAGVVELATAAQSGSATSIGETGARLVMPNSLNVTTSAGAADAGKNPVLNASGILDPTIVNATSTPTADAVVRGNGSGNINAWVGKDEQVFTANGTWTKPTNATFVEVIVIGAGGGGASGIRTNSGNNATGGGGGGGGAVSRAVFSASSLPSTVAVTVGVGGTGGAARTTDNTNGISGGDGGESSFGTWLKAGGGGGGEFGQGSGGAVSVAGGGGASSLNSAVLSTGGSPATSDTNSLSGQGISTVDNGVGRNSEWGGASGGGCTSTGPVAQAGGSSVWAGPGGGAGGSKATTTTTSGGAGGTVQSYTAGGGGAGGAAATNGTAGTDNTTLARGYCGSGGGGGGSSNGAVAGNGGNGGNPGGGGGGGGASNNGFNSGAGGNGGRGEVRVYSW